MDDDQDFMCPCCGHYDYAATTASFEGKPGFMCSRCGFAFLNPSMYSGRMLLDKFDP